MDKSTLIILEPLETAIGNIEYTVENHFSEDVKNDLTDVLVRLMDSEVSEILKST